MEKQYFVAESNIELTITAVNQDGEPITINGAQSIEFGLRDHATGTLQLTKTLAGGPDEIEIVDSETENTFIVYIDDSDTVGFEGRYVYEAKIVDAEGRVARLREKKAEAPQMIFRPKIAS